MRAVLDPSVVISGLISARGAPARLLAAWRSGRFELVVSPLLLDELRRGLDHPRLRKYVTADDAREAVRWLAQNATAAEDPDVEPVVRSVDPGDDHLIALAGAQRAALVSGDSELLALSDRIPVYSPRDFLDLVGGD